MKTREKIKNLSSNRAITLIALIITIIIMLILVGVSISLVIDSDLIGVAEDAADSTKTKYQEEASMSGVTIDGVEYDSIEDYIAAIQGGAGSGDGEGEGEGDDTTTGHNWQYTDNTLAVLKCECSECTEENAAGKTYTIGQAVSYTDNGTGSSSITGRKSGVSQAIIDEYSVISASDFGEDGLQTISKDASTTWVVFGAENTDGDNQNTNETLLLTTAAPTTGTITLYGADAYLYGPEEIDRMCTEIYGTNARAMTIEDVNKALGYTPTGGMYVTVDTTTGMQTYHTLSNFKTQLNGVIQGTDETDETYLELGIWSAIANAENVYSPEQNNNEEGKFELTTEERTLATSYEVVAEYVIDGYVYFADSSLAEAMAGYVTGVPYAPSTTSSTVKEFIFGTSNSYAYWIASRGMLALTSNFAYFGPATLSNGAVTSYSGYFSLDCSPAYYNLGLRPIVSLTSNLPTVVE